MFTNIKTTIAAAAVLGLLAHAEQQFETADQTGANTESATEVPACTAEGDA